MLLLFFLSEYIVLRIEHFYNMKHWLQDRLNSRPSWRIQDVTWGGDFVNGERGVGNIYRFGAKKIIGPPPDPLVFFTLETKW